jgi:hypothetical protein
VSKPLPTLAPKPARGPCGAVTSPTATAAKPLPVQRVSDSAWFVQGEAALGSSAKRNFISNAGFVVTHDQAAAVAGLQVFKVQGATIIAHRRGQSCLNSDTARQRLAASGDDLFPRAESQNQPVAAERWLATDAVIELGEDSFHIHHVGPADMP